MTNSDWVLIGTTLFLGAIAIWGDKIRQWIYRPKATLTFVETSPYCVKTFYRNTEAGINEPVFFFRFMAENKGSSKLKNCEAKIDQLWLYNSAGKPQRLPGFIEVSLIWATPHRPIIDLDPHRKAYCNIGHIASQPFQKKFETKVFNDIPGKHKKDLRFLFELIEFPHSQPNCLVPGKYAIKILLYSENAPTTELWFEIAWSGKWQPNESEFFRELTISKISKLE